MGFRRERTALPAFNAPMPQPDPFRLEAAPNVRPYLGICVVMIFWAVRVAYPLLQGVYAGASWRLPLLVIQAALLAFAVSRVLGARVIAVEGKDLVVRAWWNKATLRTLALVDLVDVAPAIQMRTGESFASALFRTGAPVAIPLGHSGQAGLIDSLRRHAEANRGEPPAPASA
jgi:hypothetical protein